jgi:hypothetical protein
MQSSAAESIPCAGPTPRPRQSRGAADLFHELWFQNTRAFRMTRFKDDHLLAAMAMRGCCCGGYRDV